MVHEAGPLIFVCTHCQRTSGFFQVIDIVCSKGARRLDVEGHPADPGARLSSADYLDVNIVDVGPGLVVELVLRRGRKDT